MENGVREAQGGQEWGAWARGGGGCGSGGGGESCPGGGGSPALREVGDGNGEGGSWSGVQSELACDLLCRATDKERLQKSAAPKDSLDFAAFQKFVKLLKKREDIEEIFKLLVGRDDGLTLTTWSTFLIETQQVRTLVASPALLVLTANEDFSRTSRYRKPALQVRRPSNAHCHPRRLQRIPPLLRQPRDQRRHAAGHDSPALRVLHQLKP